MIRTLIAASLLALPVPALGQETRRRDAAADPPRATIAEAAWLVGAWRGAGVRGAPALESYSAAAAGQISGHFEQLDSDGRVAFYELLQVAEWNGSLVYRLKHFDAELKGWEERDAVEQFALVAVAPVALHFDGLSFYRKGADRLRVVVRMDAPDAPSRELAFDYRRAPN